MDDLQDHWINDTQILLMDTFIDRGLNLTLGLIMHNIGNDSGVVSKISEGYKKGLFELALHGWDHVDYTKLNGEEQRVSLLKANEKMQKLFGNKSDVFIPPFNEFNNETLKAMSKVHMTVLSSSLYEEDNFDQGKSIFLAKDRASNGSSTNNNSDYTPFTSLSSSDTASPNVINTSIYKINHLPTTIEFESYHNNSWVKIPVDKILTDTFDSIVKYGYSVILLQPQSFITPDRLRKTELHQTGD